ncbi:MAG: FimV/HubP family polar landmark protein, partial [Thiolinea sp.]
AFLDSLRFSHTVQNGKPVILVTSDAPISEPFVNFLLEVTWPNGQLLKEYTVMLDPPVLMQPGSALAGSEAAVRAEPRSTGTVSRPAPQAAASPTQVAAAQAQQRAQQQAAAQQRAQQQAAAQAQQQRARQQAAAQAQQRAQQQAQAARAPASGGNRTYRVRSGDTLFRIASRLQQPGTNVDQMMMALYRANPQAFINNNINGLKAGAILRSPSANDAGTVSRAQARRQVRQQYAEWKNFRATLAKSTVPQQTASKPADTGNASQSGTATNTQSRPATPATNTAANDKARLEVLGKTDKAATDNNTSAAAGSERLKSLEQQLSLARESMVARQRENTELKSRITDLESMLRKKNRLIALRDDQLAQLQKQVSEGTTGTVTAGSNANAQQIPPVTATSTQNGTNVTPEQQAVVPRTQGQVRPLDRDMQNQVANATQNQDNRVVRAQNNQAAAQPGTQNQNMLTPAQRAAQARMQAQQEEARKAAAAAANQAENKPAAETKPESPFADQQSGGNDLMSMLTSPMAWKIGAGALLSLLLLGLLLRLLGRRKAAGRKAAATAATEDPAIYEDAQDFGDDMLQHEQPFRELEHELNKADRREALDDDPFGMDSIEGGALTSQQLADVESAQTEDEVLMEANVYIAYGLHQQAESELLKALEKHPERLDYRHKLLENYFASNNREGFDREAQAFLATPGADRHSKMWQEIAAWGKKLSPDNPVYDADHTAGAGSTVVATTAAVAGGAAVAAASSCPTEW